MWANVILIYTATQVLHVLTLLLSCEVGVEYIILAGTLNLATIGDIFWMGYKFLNYKTGHIIAFLDVVLYIYCS